VRAFLRDYQMVAPQTLQDALDLMHYEPGVWKPFSGGTDLMVLLEAGRLMHKKFVSLWGLGELRGIEESPEFVTLGALTTYSEVLASPTIVNQYPLLARAAGETGGVATQNRGTLGGNIVNASPAADSPPALLAYEADLELVSAEGPRWVPYADFHTGYKTTVLAPHEIVARIRLPRRKPGWREYYRKVGTRKAQAISKVCLAAAALRDQGRIIRMRLALGSVAPAPLRCRHTEILLEGQRLSPSLVAKARQQLMAEISPIDDLRSTEMYRRRVAANLLEEFLTSP